MAATVIGRGQELDAIEAFLREAELGPRALVLSGEAGIGKTALWEAGVDEARSRSASVLTCRGVEVEASLSFAGLSELVMPVFEEIAPALLPPRRRALEVALLRVEPGDLAPDPHAIGLALLDEERLHEGILEGWTPHHSETERLVKIHLANYFAGALLLPYEDFHDEARRTRYDIELLTSIFDSSYETVAHRVCNLADPSRRGLPFYFMRVDVAGNVSNDNGDRTGDFIYYTEVTSQPAE